MTDAAKLQAAVELDVSAAKASAKEFGQAVNSMADTVAAAGGKASGAVNNLGESTASIAQKIARANREAGVSADGLATSYGKTEKQISRTLDSLVQQVNRTTTALQTAGKSASDALALKFAKTGAPQEWVNQVLGALRQVEAEQAAQVESSRSYSRAMGELQQMQAQQTKDAAAREVAAYASVTAAIEQSYAAAKKAMAQPIASATQATNSQGGQDAGDAATKRMVSNTNELADAHVKAFQAAKLSQKATGELVEGTKAYNAALRQVPAQFTDIVVSLQGGQQPLTVLLQQGGQLKDVFGSVGGAAKALGGYILELATNPFVLLTAAVGGLAYAYYKGSKEADAYNKAITETGNISGVTSGQLQAMAAHMSEFGVTQGAAAEALALFVSQGQQGSVALERFAMSALQYSKITGTALGDVAKMFADLAKDPSQASARLNESMHYLTASTYAQIKALEDQGKHYEAAALAQTSLADALDKRKGSYESHLGYLERIAKYSKEAASGVMDWALSIGRPKTTEVSIADLTKQKAELQAALDAPISANTNFAERGYAKAQIDALNDQLTLLNKIAIRKADIAATEAASAQAEQDAVQWADRVVASLSNQEKRKKELAEIDTQAALTAGSSKPASESEVAYQKAIVNAKYDTGADVAAVKIAEDQKLQIIARAQSKIDMLRATGQTTQIGLVAEANKLEIAAIDARIDANRKEAEIVAKRPNSERELVQLNQQLRALEEERSTAAVKGSNAVIAARYAEWKVIKDQSQALNDQAKMIELESQIWGKSDSERARLTANLQIELNLEKELKRIKESGQAADDVKAQSDVARANALLEQQQAFEKARNAYFVGASKEEKDFADNLKAANAELALGVKLVGESAQVQQLENEKLKITLDLEKKIRDLKDRGDLAEADKIAEESRLRREAADQEIAAINRVTQEYWKATVEGIQTSLTDAIIAGIDGSKPAILGLRDAFVKEFENLVLRPQINAIIKPIAMDIASWFGITPGSMGAAGQASGAGGALSGAGSLYSMGSKVVDTVRGWLGLGGAAGGSATKAALYGSTGYTGAASGAAAGSSGFMGIPVVGWIAMGMMASDQAYSAGFRADTSANGIGNPTNPNHMLNLTDRALQGIGISPRVAAILSGSALGAAAQNFVFGGSGAIDHVGSGVQGAIGGSGASLTSYDAYKQDHRGFLGIGSYTTENRDYHAAPDSLTQYVNGATSLVTTSVKDYAKALGLATDGVDSYTKQIDVSLEGLDPAKQKEAIDKAIGSFGEELVQSVYGSALAGLEKAGETQGATLQRLASNLMTVNGYMDALGATLYDVGVSGAKAASSLVDAVGGLEQLNSKLSSYYDNFYSPKEHADQSFKDIALKLAAGGINISPESLAALTEAQVRAYIDAAANDHTEEGIKKFALLLDLQNQWFQAHKTSVDALAEVAKTMTSAQDALANANAKLVSAQSALASKLAQQAEEQARALKEAQDYLSGVRTNIADWIARLNSSEQGGLSDQQRRDSAWAAFMTKRTLALGGDRAAMSGITGMADQYIATVRNTSASSFDEAFAIAKIKAQVASLPNQVSAEQFIVNAVNANADTISAEIERLKTEKLVAELTVSAQSEITKAITFIYSTDAIPDEWKKIALADLSEVQKTINYVTGSTLSPDDKRIALATDDSILKTINAAAGAMDPDAWKIAIAQDAIVRKTLEASGGVLTADQKLLLNDIAEYNKLVTIDLQMNETALQHTQAILMQMFGTTSIDKIISGLQGGTPDALIDYFVKTEFATKDEATAVHNTYTAAKAYGLTMADIARATGYSIEEIHRLADKYGIPYFAAGGDHLGGIRLVGERGPELEVTGPSRIFNADQTRNILSGGFDGQDIVNELRELRVQVGVLRDQLDQANRHAKSTSDAVNGRGEQPMVVEVAA